MIVEHFSVAGTPRVVVTKVAAAEEAGEFRSRLLPAVAELLAEREDLVLESRDATGRGAHMRTVFRVKQGTPAAAAAAVAAALKQIESCAAIPVHVVDGDVAMLQLMEDTASDDAMPLDMDAVVDVAALSQAEALDEEVAA